MRENFDWRIVRIKDTRRENTQSNKTEGLIKSMIVDVWVIDTLNQLFIKGSFTILKMPSTAFKGI